MKLSSVFGFVVSLIHNSDPLNSLKVEVRNTKDILVTLGALELLYELAEVQRGSVSLPKTTLDQLPSPIIDSSFMEPMLRLGSWESQNTDECESSFQSLALHL